MSPIIEEYHQLSEEESVNKYRELFAKEQNGEIRIITLYPIIDVVKVTKQVITYTIHVEFEKLKEGGSNEQ